jgi:hypothetical protein
LSPTNNPQVTALPLSLDGAYLRLDRAKEHLADLERRIEVFGKERPGHVTVLNRDAKGVPTIRPQIPVYLPQDLSIVIGEIFYNLRAALDYLVFAMADGQQRTQFPIDEAPKDFKRHRKTFLNGVAVEHIALIESLQPYKGCKWTRFLREYSNFDKHSELHILQAGGTFKVEIFADQSTREETGRDTVRMKTSFTGDIAFANGAPVVGVLEVLHSQISQVLNQFKILLNPPK